MCTNMHIYKLCGRRGTGCVPVCLCHRQYMVGFEKCFKLQATCNRLRCRMHGAEQRNGAFSDDDHRARYAWPLNLLRSGREETQNKKPLRFVDHTSTGKMYGRFSVAQIPAIYTLVRM